MAEIRKFQKTHPWIKFLLDLREADLTLWLQLGEAQAKCEQVAGAPLLPTVVDELHQVFLAKGAQATTAIEGNTLSEEEALRLLKGELDLPPSKEYLGQEIRNIIDACNMIANGIFGGAEAWLTLDRIKELNSLVLRGLPLNEDVYPGQIREHDVGVAHYRGAPPQDCEYLLQKLCSWLMVVTQSCIWNSEGDRCAPLYGLDPSVWRWQWSNCGTSTGRAMKSWASSRRRCRAAANCGNPTF